MRIWTMIFALLGCLGVFLIGRRRYSNGVGFAAAGILATSLLYYAHSRIIILDLVNAVLMSGTLWCLFLFCTEAGARKTNFKPDLETDTEARQKNARTTLYLAYAFAALNCLTKGLIGIFLPGFVLSLWIIFTRNWQIIPKLFSWIGLAIFAIIFLPWHVLMALHHDDFLHKYFVVEHFLRYTTNVHCRYQPSWFFIPIVLAGLFPWTGFSLVAIKESFRRACLCTDTCSNFRTYRRSEDIFLLCWIFGIFAFFSFSHSKLIPYILPIFPPTALMTARSTIDAIHGKISIKTPVFINLFFFASAVLAFFLARKQIADVLAMDQFCVHLCFAAGALVLLAFFLIYALFTKRHRGVCLLAFLLGSGFLMCTINKAMVYYQDVKKPSTKRMAEIIRLNKRDSDVVCCYKRYYQDFPVYLRDIVKVTDFVGELEFGAESEPQKGRDTLITFDQLKKMWGKTEGRIFLLLSRLDYREFFSDHFLPHRLLDCDKNFVAIIGEPDK